MDETLLYSYPEIYTSKNNFYYKTVIRPYLLEFLRELKPYYELILFTAAEEVTIILLIIYIYLGLIYLLKYKGLFKENIARFRYFRFV